MATKKQKASLAKRAATYRKKKQNKGRADSVKSIKQMRNRAARTGKTTGRGAGKGRSTVTSGAAVLPEGKRMKFYNRSDGSRGFSVVDKSDKKGGSSRAAGPRHAKGGGQRKAGKGAGLKASAKRALAKKAATIRRRGK